MLKIIEKEIKKLENMKDRKTKSKNQLEKDLTIIDKKLKELYSYKVQCEKIQIGLDNCLNTPNDNSISESID